MPPPRMTSLLVQEASAGDAVALDELLVRFMPEMMAFLRLRMGAVLTARESASDLAQSACREALQDLSKFEYRGESSFRRWLFLLAERKLVSRARYWARERRDAKRDVPPLDAEVRGLANLFTPSREAIAKEQLSAFWRALDALPEDQRNALALCKGLGMQPSEAAEELGKTPNAVRMALFRGMARLAILEDEFEREVNEDEQR